MDWQSDPVLFRQEMERRVRQGLVRTAIIWAPFLLASIGLLVYFFVIPLVQDGSLRLVALILFGGLTILCGFQVYSAVKDLRSGPRTTRGEVARAWRARDSLVFRSYYIRLTSRQILRGDYAFHGNIRNGDYIEATYFPRSSVIIECSRVEPPAATGTPPITLAPHDRGDDDETPAGERDDLRRRLGL